VILQIHENFTSSIEGAGFFAVKQAGMTLCEDQAKTNPGACTPGLNVKLEKHSLTALADEPGVASFLDLLVLSRLSNCCRVTVVRTRAGGASKYRLEYCRRAGNSPDHTELPRVGP
jgi:hypothetical protein